MAKRSNVLGSVATVDREPYQQQSQQVRSNQLAEQTNVGRVARVLQLIACFTLCLSFSVPLVAKVIGYSDSAKLGGVTQRVKQVDLSWSSFVSGEYQRATAERLQRELPFRGKLVRSTNQWMYSLFGVMATRSRNPLVVGHQHTLFEMSYLDAFNRVNPLPEAKLRSVVDQLAAFQTALEEHGIAFLVVISPNKASFYSERLPSYLIRSDRLDKSNDLEQFLTLSQAAGVAVVNTIPLLKALEQEFAYPSFAKGGTHWSYFAACHVSAKISVELGRLLQKPVAVPSCEPVVESRRAKYSDADILQLANIWDTKSFAETLAYPRERMQFAADAFHPSALFVGDSFSWMPLHYFDVHGIFSKRKFYYYFRTQTTSWIEPRADGSVRRRTGVRRKVDRTAIDWEQDLLQRNAVVFIVNERALDEVGYGYMEQALPQLRARATK